MSKKISLFCLVFGILFLLWEISARLFPHLLFVLPAPSDIFMTLFEMKSRFWMHTCVTFREMCTGFFLALVFAFPLAWIMLSFETTRTLLQPLFIVIQCLPMFTLAPIMVVWFGWGYTAIVIPTALMIFFPLTLNIYQGLRSTPKDLLEFFQTNSATPFQTFFKLRLPWARSHIFAGFRISAAIAGVGAVAGEWAGAEKGLGILMLESRRNVDLEITFGALLCLTLMSIFLYTFILVSEKLFSMQKLWKLSLFENVLGFMKSKKKDFAFPLILFAFFLFLLAGCQNEKSSVCKAESSQTKVSRLLLDWLPNPNHIPLYVGIDQGFFEDEGIHLVIQKLHENGSGISYLTAQKADLLVNHLPGTLKACSKGAQLKIVGLLIKEPLRGLIYRADLPIEKTSDLSGYSLGYCIGGPDTAFLDFLLRQGNIEPKERKNVSVDLISAMGTRMVDFIYGGYWNIEPAQLSALGVETKWFTIEELAVPKYYEMIILANDGSQESAPGFVKRFQSALQKAIEFCKMHPDEAFGSYLSFNLDKKTKTIHWEKKAWEKTVPLLANDQNIDSQEIKTFYEWQLTQKILMKPFDFQGIIP